MMKAQDIFDKVATHLIEQGGPAENDEVCAYRAEGGLKCAVGCLISDKNYRKDMEGKSVTSLVLFEKRKGMKRFVNHLPLLEDLQNAHDYEVPLRSRKVHGRNMYRTRDLKKALRNIAEKHGLSDAVIS